MTLSTLNIKLSTAKLERYSDEAICKAAGYEYKSTKNRKPFSKKSALLCEIYPNPATSYTTLRFNSIPDGILTINISDILGRTVYNYSDELNANNFNINTSNILSGIYFVTVTTKDKVVLNTKLKIDNQ